MGQGILYLGLCLLACLIFNPLVEGAGNKTVASRSRCAGGFPYKQFCYHYAENPETWAYAEVKCQKLIASSQLASIHSPRELAVISDRLNSAGTSEVWIGLEATPGISKLIWEWSDGSTFTSRLWDNRSPSTYLSEPQCVSLHKPQGTDAWQWLQSPCSKRLPSLCKYKATY